jgi:hypothetical protein
MFAAWTIEHMERAAVPSGTRMLKVIVARLSGHNTIYARRFRARRSQARRRI